MNHWVVDVFNLLMELTAEYQSDTARIYRSFEAITRKLNTLEQKLDDSVFTTANQALNHLIDGLNADDEKIRDEELREARRQFGRLASLDTRGTTGVVENKYLIGLGSWGKFLCFHLAGENRVACINAYEYTKSNPEIGLLMFPARVFSKNYTELIEEATRGLTGARESLIRTERDNNQEGLRSTGQSLVPVALVLAGVTAPLWVSAVPVLAPIMPAVGGVAVGCFSLASQASRQQTEPTLQDTENLRQEISQLENEINELWAELVQECQTRLEEIKIVNFDNLQGLL